MDRSLFLKWVLELANQEYSGDVSKFIRVAEHNQLELEVYL